MTRSLPRFFIHATVAVLVLAGAAAFIASRSEAESPPPEKPLAQAVQEALTAPAPAGVSGRIEFSNRLVDADAVPTRRSTTRCWPAPRAASGSRGDGHARLELETPAGDVQVELDGDRWSLYEPASQHGLRGRGADAGPRRAGRARSRRHAADAEPLHARVRRLSDAEPGTVAGKAAYTVRISPRHDGGLLGAAEVAWDAAHGVPLRGAVYAQGEPEPVLEVEATDVDFGPVAGVRRRDPAAGGRARRRAPERGAGSRTAAPGGSGERDGEGRGAGEAPVRAGGAGLGRRPPAPLDPHAAQRRRRGRARDLRQGARRAAGRPDRRRTAAGRRARPPCSGCRSTARPATSWRPRSARSIQFERDGVSYTVIGSVPPAAAEAAARAL